MYQRITVVLLVSFGLLQLTYGQTLKEQINNMFEESLDLHLSPGEHGQHFLPVNVASSRAIINSMNNFIGTSASSFPLSSSTAGVTFDFSSGRPVPTSTSFGPIFAERSQTVGQGRINMGLNFTTINFKKIRGISMEDVQLTFTHQDVGDPGMGDSPNEFDTMDFFLNMDVSASVFAMYFTYGVADRFDISVAVPFINVKITSNPLAVINSYTWVSNDSANHFFGGTQTEPILEKRPTPINDDATGVGDIALRAKYNFIRDKAVDFGAMLEYRLSTGDAENFLGSGFSSLRTVLIASKILENFAPHLNLAYWKKFTNKDRDEFEFTVGFDQKIAEWLTMAIDVLGRIDLGAPLESQRFPDNVDIKWTVGNTNYVKSVSPTNIPNYSRDNIIDAAFGFKIFLKQSLLIVSNVFVPLNDDGLRASIGPTFGLEFIF
jgi:hypothetical protein